MEPNKIQNADILDIIFEGRNKDYGAYELRKTYNKRIVNALFVTGSVIGLLLIGGAVAGFGNHKMAAAPVMTDVSLENVKQPDKPVVIPPAPKVEVPKVETKQWTPPKIVADKDVKPDEKPPENKDLDDVKIGSVNQEGVKDDGIMAPPVSDEGKGVVAAPAKRDDDDGIFIKVEKESEFPGGSQAWLRFLYKNLRFPDEAVAAGIQGAVTVQFIVDKEGNVSDVEAVSGPEQGGLREEAVRVIKKSGKWTPAEQNGRFVKSYKRQPITFHVEE